MLLPQTNQARHPNTIGWISHNKVLSKPSPNSEHNVKTSEFVLLLFFGRSLVVQHSNVTPEPAELISTSGHSQALRPQQAIRLPAVASKALHCRLKCRKMSKEDPPSCESPCLMVFRGALYSPFPELSNKRRPLAMASHTVPGDKLLPDTSISSK